MSTWRYITIDQGSNFKYILTLKDINGNPINVAANTFTSKLRQAYSEANSWVINVAADIANVGNVILSLSANATANIPSGRYVFDVLTIDTSNNVTRIAEGTAMVTPLVTY